LIQNYVANMIFIAEPPQADSNIRVKRVAPTIFSALIGLRAFATGSNGHMVIAAESFRHVPRRKVRNSDVLKSPPDRGKWDLATLVRMRSSTRLDEISKSGNQYNDPGWRLVENSGRRVKFLRLKI
jgi:hypothetical protein